MKLALSELLLVLWFRRSLLKSAFFCLSTTAGVSASPALFILVHIEWPWITFLGLFGIFPPHTVSVSIFHLVVCFSFVWILRLWFCCSIFYLVYHQLNNQLFRELKISFLGWLWFWFILILQKYWYCEIISPLLSSPPSAFSSFISVFLLSGVVVVGDTTGGVWWISPHCWNFLFFFFFFCFDIPTILLTIFWGS